MTKSHKKRVMSGNFSTMVTRCRGLLPLQRSLQLTMLLMLFASMERYTLMEDSARVSNIQELPPQFGLYGSRIKTLTLSRNLSVLLMLSMIKKTGAELMLWLRLTRPGQSLAGYQKKRGTIDITTRNIDLQLETPWKPLHWHTILISCSRCIPKSNWFSQERFLERQL